MGKEKKSRGTGGGAVDSAKGTEREKQAKMLVGYGRDGGCGQHYQPGVGRRSGPDLLLAHDTERGHGRVGVVPGKRENGHVLPISGVP